MDNKRPELFFGLVSAVGSETKELAHELEKQLNGVGYNSHHIRLSDLMKLIAPKDELDKINKSEDEIQRVNAYMSFGNKLRNHFQMGEAVALLALEQVRNIRQEISGNKDETPAYNNAYIINSLKHPEEVDRLRSIYGDSFFVISLYSPKEKRKAALLKKIQKSKSSDSSKQSLENDLDNLIERDEDEHEEVDSFGQCVRNTFPLADVFVSEEKDLSCQIKRFVSLVFGSYFTTPTKDEQGMFLANAAAMRSSDLSRQVGALISRKDGSVISMGCNDVPQPLGGIFWEGEDAKDVEDYRDWKTGKDSNALTISKNIEELCNKLSSAEGVLSEDFKKQDIDSQIETIKQQLIGSGISSAIEYGRVVHAEMNAISEAVRHGVSTQNTTIYCTTFPCHMCARHIISSGIERVVFIEPYPKSLTKDLYERMVIIDNDNSKTVDSNAVKLESFIGISPKMYATAFKKITKRKDKKGYALHWNAKSAEPCVTFKYNSYLNNEILFSLKILEGIKTL